jgi:hypothetical protein
VIVGAAQFGTFTVREDDALTSGGALAPAVGTQGDVCAEYAARSVVQELTTSGDAVAGSHVTLTGSGYRVGELVAFTDGDAVLGTVLAGADGTAALDWAVPADARVGGHDVTAVGAGSARTAKATVTVRSATTTTLAIAPAAPAVGKAVTLTATVAGPDTAGTVTFADGSTVLGRVAVKDGRAALVVSGGFDAGTHTLTAAFGQTATAEGSVSPAVTFTLVKGKTTTVFVLAATRTTYGTAVAGRIVVGGADGGVATITVGNVVRSDLPGDGVVRGVPDPRHEQRAGLPDGPQGRAEGHAVRPGHGQEGCDRHGDREGRRHEGRRAADRQGRRQARREGREDGLRPVVGRGEGQGPARLGRDREGHGGLPGQRLLHGGVRGGQGQGRHEVAGGPPGR